MLEKRQALIDLATSWRGAAGATSASASLNPPRKKIAIDALVAWAYRVELPKTPRAVGPALPARGWGKIDEWARELPLAGLDDNRYGVTPDLTAQGFPHADALAVHAAVERLADCALVLPDGWNPLGDMPDLGALGAAVAARALESLTVICADGERRLRRSAERLVFRHAVCGGSPDWVLVEPARDVERRENGAVKWFVRQWRLFDGPAGPDTIREEIEVDGYDYRTKSPKANAYVREVLTPDPFIGVCGRADYEIWHAALCALASDLQGVLLEHDVTPPAFPARPWETAPAASENCRGRVLRAKSAPAPRHPRFGRAVAVGSALKWSA